MFEIGSLINAFGSVTWVVFFAILAISIIVAVHEYGHYIVGRWCGIHAEVFSVGFGPVLMSRYDRRGTRWQIAALPFGGYVKFKGDANAASAPDAHQLNVLNEEERRHTMHGAPVWARAATAAAGPVFNFMLTIVLYAGVFMWQGQLQDSLVIEKMQDLPVQNELRVGDQIVGVAGNPVDSTQSYGNAISNLPESLNVTYQVLRDGAERDVVGPYPSTTSVASLTPNSAAIQAGLKLGDVITAVNGEEVQGVSDIQKSVIGSDGATLRVEVWRGGDIKVFDVTPKRVDLPLPEGGFETRWLMGVGFGSFFEPARVKLPFIEAVGYAAQRTWDIITGSLSGLYHIVIGSIGSCNLSGPVTIANVAGQMASQGTVTFLTLLAFMSTGIGLMNLFPIPMLDGGHLMFCAYEAITGRPPSDRAMQFLMTLGAGLVFSLMIFVILNDFMCP